MPSMGRRRPVASVERRRAALVGSRGSSGVGRCGPCEVLVAGLGCDLPRRRTTAFAEFDRVAPDQPNAQGRGDIRPPPGQGIATRLCPELDPGRHRLSLADEGRAYAASPSSSTCIDGSRHSGVIATSVATPRLPGVAISTTTRLNVSRIHELTRSGESVAGSGGSV